MARTVWQEPPLSPYPNRATYRLTWSPVGLKRE
jgi:hypothetical protein